MGNDGTTGDLGRFAEPALLILVSLAEAPKHGYAIMTDVNAFAANLIGPGTLYAALARLERRGLIEPMGPDDRRRPYRLTATGSRALETHLAEMRHLVEVEHARLRAADG
ncbi:MAG: PadR family transcriptional regulator [Chloroflexota bacterium]